MPMARCAVTMWQQLLLAEHEHMVVCKQSRTTRGSFIQTTVEMLDFGSSAVLSRK